MSLTTAGQISFRASPRLAVETVTDEVSLDCKIPPAITDVYMSVMVMIKQTNSNGDGELLNVLKTSNKVEMTGGNRSDMLTVYVVCTLISIILKKGFMSM